MLAFASASRIAFAAASAVMPPPMIRWSYRCSIASDQRDGHVDIAARRIGVRTDFVVRLVDQGLRDGTIDARHLHLEFDRDAETVRDRADADRAFDRRVCWYRHFRLRTGEFHRTDETRGVAAGEQLLGIDALSAAAHLLRRLEHHIDASIGTARTTVASAGGGSVCGVDDFFKFHGELLRWRLCRECSDREPNSGGAGLLQAPDQRIGRTVVCKRYG